MHRAGKPHNATKLYVCNIYMYNIYMCAHTFMDIVSGNCHPFKGLFLHFCKIRSTIGGWFLEDKMKVVAKKNFISLAL